MLRKAKASTDQVCTRCAIFTRVCFLTKKCDSATGGPYAIFAGRDATRGMAKQSFESDMLTDIDKPLDTLQDLTPSEWTNLLEWESHFRNKYFVCGELVES